MSGSPTKRHRTGTADEFRETTESTEAAATETPSIFTNAGNAQQFFVTVKDWFNEALASNRATHLGEPELRVEGQHPATPGGTDFTPNYTAPIPVINKEKFHFKITNQSNADQSISFHLNRGSETESTKEFLYFVSDLLRCFFASDLLFSHRNGFNLNYSEAGSLTGHILFKYHNSASAFKIVINSTFIEERDGKKHFKIGPIFEQFYFQQKAHKACSDGKVFCNINLDEINIEHAVVNSAVKDTDGYCPHAFKREDLERWVAQRGTDPMTREAIERTKIMSVKDYLASLENVAKYEEAKRRLQGQLTPDMTLPPEETPAATRPLSSQFTLCRQRGAQIARTRAGVLPPGLMSPRISRTLSQSMRSTPLTDRVTRTGTSSAPSTEAKPTDNSAAAVLIPTAPTASARNGTAPLLRLGTGSSPSGRTLQRTNSLSGTALAAALSNPAARVLNFDDEDDNTPAL